MRREEEKREKNETIRKNETKMKMKK